MSLPKVSIIIVNWNNFHDSSECLESLSLVTYPNCEIVVVDNGSGGGEAMMLREGFGDSIRLIENETNHGFAEGCNIGMRDALERGADYIVLLNNDTIVTPDFLEDLINVAHGDERVGILGGKIYCHEYPDTIWFAGGLINYWTGNTPIRGSGEVDNGQFEEIIEVDWVCGCLMFISRELLQSVGMLDKRFFFGWEDVDLCVRAAKERFRILFVPGSKIWHKGFAPGKKERLMGLPVYYATRGMFLFMEKHFSKLQIGSCLVYRIITFPTFMWSYSRVLGNWKVPIYIIWGSFGYLWHKMANMLNIKRIIDKSEP